MVNVGVILICSEGFTPFKVVIRHRRTSSHACIDIHSSVSLLWLEFRLGREPNFFF